MEPNMAALQSFCLGLSKDSEARDIGAEMWTSVVSALTADPTADVEALGRNIRLMISKSHKKSYKTLTNAVSTAKRAIILGVVLHHKGGAVIGRTEVEKQCQIADAKVLEEARRKVGG